MYPAEILNQLDTLVNGKSKREAIDIEEQVADALYDFGTTGNPLPLEKVATEYPVLANIIKGHLHLHASIPV